MNSNPDTNPTPDPSPSARSNFWINLALFLSVLLVPLGLHFLLNPDTAFAAVSKQVEATGAMQVPRVGHTATLVTLADGSTRVIIAGGVNGQAVLLSSIEIFDPATGTINNTDNAG